MNDTTPPPGTPSGAPHNGGASTPSDPPGAGQTHGSEGFFGWLRGLGIVRGGDRWFAGVAAGIAAKAGIDPLIVRGIFVVLAILGGPGILLYLAGWLLLPDARGRIHIEEIIRGRASAGVIVAVVILGALIVIPAMLGLLPGMFAGPWAWDAWGFTPDWVRVTFTVLWWAIIVPALIIWFIVWVSRRGARGGAAGTPTDPGAPTSSGTPGGPESAASFTERAESWAEDAGARANDWGEEFGRKAEEWGLKVEEKSKEWERAGAQYYESHKLGAAHVVITLACALLAAGAAAAWALSISTDRDALLTAGLVAAVAVLGVSMIVAGIRGRHTGWVGFLAIVGIITLIFAPFTGVLPKDTRFVPFGNVDTRVVSNTPDNALVMLAGNAQIDLSALRSVDDAREIDVWLIGGNVTVSLPDAHPVTVQASLIGGNVKDQRTGSSELIDRGAFISRTIHSGDATAGSGERTTVRVHVVGGNVTVHNGTTVTKLDSSDTDEIVEMQREIAELEQALRDQADARTQIERDQERLEDLQQELENAR